MPRYPEVIPVVWEYKTVCTARVDSGFEEVLAEYDDTTWELVAVVVDPRHQGELVYCFKRPKLESP